MILPLGDAPNPRGIPFVNYGLILANVAVYLFLTLPLSNTPVDPRDPLLPQYVTLVTRQLPPHVPVQAVLQQLSAYDLFIFRHGFRPAAPHLATLFCALFLHAGFMHLFGNMLILWIYGDNVEFRLGRLGYLLAYLASGVVATGFFTLFALGSPMPLIGASGAISGVLGFYFRWFPHNKVRLLVFFFPFLFNVIVVSARIVLGFYLVIDNLLPFLLNGGTAAGVAYGAHIGGFLLGLTTAWMLDHRALRMHPAEYRGIATPLDAGAAPGSTIRQLLADNRFREAAATYFALDPTATRGAVAAADLLALADWLRHAGNAPAALLLYQRLLRDFPTGPGAAAAHVGAGLVQLESLGQPTPAYQHFLDALDLDPAPDTAAQARAALEAIAARQKLQLGRPRLR